MAEDTPIETGISTAGTVVVVLLLCAQLPVMYQVIRHVISVETISVLPTIGQGANFIAWTVYGVVGQQPAIFRVNAIGCGFFTLYLLIFLVYSRGAHLRQVLLFFGAALLVLVAVCVGIILGFSSEDQQTYALGWFATICNVIMYASPLSQIRIALVTMEPSSIPVLLTLAGTGCSVLWGLYGWMKGNWFVLGPNIAGVALSILQIVIAAYIILAVRANPALRKGHRDGVDPSKGINSGGHDDGHGHDEHEHDDHNEHTPMVAPSSHPPASINSGGIAGSLFIRKGAATPLAAGADSHMYSPLPGNH